jgi:hypothetical protein
MKKKNKPKSRQQATELRDKIKGVILDGDSFRRRVAADLAEPIKYPRNDGVLFLPEWQDEFIDRVTPPERTARLLRIIQNARQQKRTSG